MKKLLVLLMVVTLCLGMALAASAETFGLGTVTSIGSLKAAVTDDGVDYDGQAQVNTTSCALVLNDDGTIKFVKWDTTQTKVTFSPKGEVTNDLEAEILTKMEKQEAYGMRKASSIGAEWFEQIAALEAWCIGKTVADVLAVPTYDKGDGNHTQVPDVEELKATCTITIGEYLKSLEKAAAAAK